MLVALTKLVLVPRHGDLFWDSRICLMNLGEVVRYSRLLDNLFYLVCGVVTPTATIPLRFGNQSGFLPADQRGFVAIDFPQNVLDAIVPRNHMCVTL